MSSRQAGRVVGSAFTSRDLEDLRREAAEFAAERDWEQFHSPRSLLLALLSEAGEAADVVRWLPDGAPIPEARKTEWEHELADILIMLVRLADRSGVDLTAAFAAKMEIARARYPVDSFKGSNRKYDA